jgi:hypothetical protein
VHQVIGDLSTVVEEILEGAQEIELAKTAVLTRAEVATVDEVAIRDIT